LRRLALVGATEAEIATLTGHTLRDVRAIMDTHYLHRDPALGESAIAKLERGTKPSRGNWASSGQHLLAMSLSHFVEGSLLRVLC
jgi:hypothetical protein